MTYIQTRQQYQRPQAMIWAESDSISLTDYEVGSNQSPQTFLITSDHNRSDIGISVDRIEGRKRMINGRMRSYHTADKLTISVSWEMLPSRRYSDNPDFEARVVTVTNVTPDGTNIVYTANNTFTANVDSVNISDIDPTDFNLSSALVIASNTTSFTVASNVTGTYVSGGTAVTTDYGTSPLAGYSVGQYTADGGAGGEDLLYWYENHTGPFYVFLAYDKPKAFSENQYEHLNEYSQVVEMYISDFSYNVIKRGQNTYDMWNVSVTLEEV